MYQHFIFVIILHMKSVQHELNREWS